MYMRLKTIFYLILTSILCFSCSTKNEEQEYEVVEVEQICEKCYGEGYIMDYCDMCNGNGGSNYYSKRSVPEVCSHCGGIGEVICNRCGGKGKDYVNCSHCNSGVINCGLCKGRGQIIRSGFYDTCPLCEGSRYATCHYCNGSYRTVKYCCGDGTQRCNNCFGSGYSGSKTVEESGFKTCSYCNGRKGHQVQCNECKGLGKIIIIEMRQY